MTVKIPGNAVQTSPPADEDIQAPTIDLLRGLSLLPKAGELGDASGLSAAFAGPPDSVAVIEAGATAASKWWATGIAGGAAAVTGRIVQGWDSLGKGGPWNQPFAILAMGVVLAAAAVGIAYLLGSDVRGRAAAMVATIEARRDVAIAMVCQAGSSFQSHGATASAAPTAWSGLPIALSALAASNVTKHGDVAEAGWKAIATRERSGKTEFLLVKATESAWVDSSDVDFA